MTTQSSSVTSKPLAWISTLWARCLLTLLLAAFGTVVFPATSRATITFDLGQCVSSEGCDQTINFPGNGLGTTVVDDTNPPNPFYHVSATSDGTVVLDTSGGTIKNDIATAGLTRIVLTPVCPAPDGLCYGWTTIEFQLDSLKGAQPLGTLGLVLTAIDQKGVSFSSGSLAFPWEGNNGENQHYHVHSDYPNEIITQLIVTYADPLGGGNTIQDMHNIDVHSAPVPVPEPSSFLLVGLSLLAIRPFLRRYL